MTTTTTTTMTPPSTTTTNTTTNTTTTITNDNHNNNSQSASAPRETQLCEANDTQRHVLVLLYLLLLCRAFTIVAWYVFGRAVRQSVRQSVSCARDR